MMDSGKMDDIAGTFHFPVPAVFWAVRHRNASSVRLYHWLALVSFPFFFSQLLSRRFKSNMLENLTGQWQDLEHGGEAIPVGGVYWLVGLTLRRRLAAERRVRYAHDGDATCPCSRRRRGLLGSFFVRHDTSPHGVQHALRSARSPAASRRRRDELMLLLALLSCRGSGWWGLCCSGLWWDRHGSPRVAPCGWSVGHAHLVQRMASHLFPCLPCSLLPLVQPLLLASCPGAL